jgi:hypothetical protein
MSNITERKKTGKVFTDHHGNEIPAAYIHKIDKQKDATAKKLHAKAVKLSKALQEFKNEALTQCDALYEQMLEENKVTIRENARGGYSIMTIDKAIKVEITISETISFNEKIDFAQSKIKEYLAEKTQGVDNDLQLLVNEAFKTRKGRLDTKRVIGLLKLNITHRLWVEAMELIKQSIEQNNTKRYMRIWERQQDGGYGNIKLDFASI